MPPAFTPSSPKHGEANPVAPFAMRDQSQSGRDELPLCVDLDGTLLRSDLLWESFVRMLHQCPWCLFRVPFWLARGRARLKCELASRVRLNAASLPMTEGLVAFLRAEKATGRQLILATASNEHLAAQSVAHLGLFAEVIGSDCRTNLLGRTKAEALVKRFGQRGFDYAGNSFDDLPVWQQARNSIAVNASKDLLERMRQTTPANNVFGQAAKILPALARALRPHQWVKNIIILVPLLTAHQLHHWPGTAFGLWAFASFCLCASGVYVLNDLLDLEADRQHATKRKRPFAAGELALPIGLGLVGVLFAASATLAALLSWHFLATLAIYGVLSSAYSLRLKSLPLVDVFVLAALYTLRLVAGHEATGLAYSSWLLMFSMFVFLSLALMKRFQELFALRQQNQQAAKGRGYTAHDLEFVAMLGAASGFMSVLVLALYVNSQEVRVLYQRPMLLLLVCPLLLYWICRAWLLAHRGQMHDDPIVFALKDRVGYVVGALTLALVFLAT